MRSLSGGEMNLALIPGVGSIGGTEMIIALVIILLLFGAKKIPELARGLGSGVREFKAGTKEGQLEDEKKKEEELKSAETDNETANAETNGSDAQAETDSSVESDKTEQQQSR
jgi:sec-independent protein translocase protein TatA